MCGASLTRLPLHLLSSDAAGSAEPPPLKLAVIGAGPHALSLLCRIIDDAPDLLDEGERAHIMSKAGMRAAPHQNVRKALRRRFAGPAALDGGVAVFDQHGGWMEQWSRDFAALEIDHCRSHSDLHPCPNDFQSLRVWAAVHKRQAEIWHMQYLDREESRKAGYTGPYALPGTKLFIDFCASLVTRYTHAGVPCAARRPPRADAPPTRPRLPAEGTSSRSS